MLLRFGSPLPCLLNISCTCSHSYSEIIALYSWVFQNIFSVTDMPYFGSVTAVVKQIEEVDDIENQKESSPVPHPVGQSSEPTVSVCLPFKLSNYPSPQFELVVEANPDKTALECAGNLVNVNYILRSPQSIRGSICVKQTSKYISKIDNFVVHEIPLTNSISDSALISRIHEAINDTYVHPTIPTYDTENGENDLEEKK
ncbi:hypothetical protein H8356DRAFT_1356148 [Neocallimastix lanati (nom. inval.)]|nr:hypothetical protein H8356DRAFT_1356148 [Neocallimastix sp. JGI-2020a]